MRRVEYVRVGDVLRLERRQVAVDIAREYEEIGVRSFGRGIFHKEPVDGATLRDKRVFYIEPGDLVISNVFAWEGAIAVSSEAERGKIGSHRFMTFASPDGRVDTTWASWFFLSESGLELIRKASPGSAGRNRTLAIKRVEDLVIPLPPLEEQRRDAAWLHAVREALVQTGSTQERARSYQNPMVDAAINQIMDRGVSLGWEIHRLGNLAVVNPSRSRIDQDGPAAFVPMAAVSAEQGEIVNPETRPAGTLNGSYRQFKKGDILFARITPCMQNGKTAIFIGPLEYGYGSSEFHIVRAFEETHVQWIHRFLRSQRLRGSAAERMTGTAGQQRVPAGFLNETLVPLPPAAEIATWVAAIDRLSSFRLRLHTLEQRASTLRKAIEPAVMNQAFESLR